MFTCGHCGEEVDTVYFHQEEEVCESCLRLMKENEKTEEAPGSDTGKQAGQIGRCRGKSRAFGI